MKSLILFLSFFTSIHCAYATCLIPADKIEEVAKKIVWENEAREKQNVAVIQATATGYLTDENSHSDIDYEAFIRPDEDGTFQLLPLPLFVMEMQSTRDSVYICAHIDSENEEKNEMVLYFLRYGSIRTVTPKPLPLMSVKNFFWKTLGKTPLVIAALPLQITETVQTTTINLISDFTKVGIDRVRITGQQIELYSGGNPAQFDSYMIKKVIPLKDK